MVSAVTILGMLGLTGGLIGYFAYPIGVKMGIDYVINLDQGGMVYPLYMNPTFATLAKYHLYEVLNPRWVFFIIEKNFYFYVTSSNSKPNFLSPLPFLTSYSTTPQQRGFNGSENKGKIERTLCVQVSRSLDY